MLNSSAIPNKQYQRFHYISALVAVLIIVVVVAFFAFRDPLLNNNKLTIQAVADKSSYVKGEDVFISVYVFNGKDEPFIQPTTIDYTVLNNTGQEVYSVRLNMNFPTPPPTFPAHTKTLYSNHVWNQKNLNNTLVESGNYTIKVIFEYGTFECNIQIAE